MRDEEYVLKARNGDEGACESLLNKYKPMVRSISRAYFLLGGDQEDVVQEGMIGLYPGRLHVSSRDGGRFPTGKREL